MALHNETYHYVIVESFVPDYTSGLHGKVHVRPAKNQMFDRGTHVECPKEMKDPARFPVGTRFRIKAKLTDREGGKPYLYSHHSWRYEVLAGEQET